MSCQVNFPLQDIVMLLRDKINPEIIGAVPEEKLEEEVLSFIQPKIDELQEQLTKLPPEVHVVTQALQGSVLETTLNNGKVLSSDLSPLFVKFDGLVSLYEKNVKAGAGANGWVATLVKDASGLTQQQVNDKTALFYNTVADMVADTKLKAGKAVITHGYYTPNDGGGARYLIKDTATDYSIPVANNLHAVFADSFDIRKFGIVDSKTKDQDVELARMRNYADTREYEIDFHNFWIRAPKENYPYMGKGKYLGTVKGLWFEQAHKYKNLKITHDKTVRLNTGEHLLVFAPVTNPDVETWVEFENITLDAWCDNNQPFTEDYNGYYDGQRNGIFCHPRHKEMGGEIANWGQQTNFSFKFKHIHFETPAYSYNITTSAICARQNIIENVTGTYVGLLYNFQALDVIAKDILVHRDKTKMEAGRLMVGTILHHEPELGGMSRDFNKYYFENVRGTISGGTVSQLFKLSPIGNMQTFKEIEIIDCDGEVVLEGKNATTHKFTRSGGEGTNSFINTIVGTTNITDFVVKAFPFSPEYGIPAILLVGNTTITTLNIDRCVIIDPLTEWSSRAVGSITNLNITDSIINDAGIGSDYGGIWLVCSYDVKVDHITLTRVITDVRALLKCECKIVNINDILIQGAITSDYMDFKIGTFCNLYCYDVKYAATQTEGTYFTKGDHYLRIHGGVEEKSKITASSSSPYHGVKKSGIASSLYTNEITSESNALAAGASMQIVLAAAVDANMKSYSTQMADYHPEVSVNTTVNGKDFIIRVTNISGAPYTLPPTKFIVRQVI